MEINQQQFEQIEAYLLGSLPRDEREAFEKEMQQNEALREEVAMHKELQMTVKVSNMKDRLEAIHHKKYQNATAVSLSWTRYAVAASVALLLGFLAFLWFTGPPSYQDTFYAVYTPDPGLPSLMGAEHQNALQEAMVDYKQGAYDQALVAFESLLKENPQNDTLLFYTGVTWLAMKEPQKAIHYLEQVSSYTPSLFQKSHWYLGLVYLYEGDINTATTYIQLIATRPNHPFYDQAVQLLEMLNLPD